VPLAASRARFSSKCLEAGAQGWNIDQWRVARTSQYLLRERNLTIRAGRRHAVGS
jgi:hypothetical protein